ncbi:hypothetical protein PFICI_12263 [Pestalotiopsis fici W106-1]|uniref:Xylanolytic transcriptional activator regulatory domain-containing protein n=1 Tax=Pestalotiopsis fici (strain W106-1 / CGMCC3.15140) TaxID=1229662 RepID=W3WNF8_PESFW|nr:uncharacterized protein PFICI_12263 [Pestalotiopsis fici W106-1]ETS75319.1 hypothetical protein PFICI_12263 [Pestalotiopsis fici W106-1]
MAIRPVLCAKLLVLMSRSHLLTLEERVTQQQLHLERLQFLLEKNNIPHDNQTLISETGREVSRQIRAQASVHPPQDTPLGDAGPDAGHPGPYAAATQAMLDRILDLTQRRAVEEPPFSQILLRRFISAKSSPQVASPISPESILTRKRLLPDLMHDLVTTKVSLPSSREAADSLADAYFQFANTGLPLLHETSFRQKLDFVYASPELVDLGSEHCDNDFKLAVFFVFAVFAVAIVIRQKRDPFGIPITLADRYHKMALQFLDDAVVPNDYIGVQALLLIAMYSYHHPTTWDVWKPVGAALRLAIELGLHKDQETTEFDALILDTKRRVFWVAYAMDRSVAIAINMPLGISDGSITTKFPNEVDDEFIKHSGINAPEDGRFWSKSLSIHLFRYRQLQSEIQNILCEKPWPVNSTLDLDRWQHQMHARLWAWYKKCPGGSNLNDDQRINLENFELSLYRALLFLYSPSPNISEPSDAALVALSEVATNLVQIYSRSFREYKLTILWQAVENLSSAGTSLLYSYTHSASVRQRVAIKRLESLVHTCSSVLWGMVEHFPAFKGKRDAFDILASATMADITANAEKENSSFGWPRDGNQDMFGGRDDVGMFMDDEYLENGFFEMRAEEFHDRPTPFSTSEQQRMI